MSIRIPTAILFILAVITLFFNVFIRYQLGITGKTNIIAVLISIIFYLTRG